MADFAEACGLNRALVARRLKYLIGKIKASLQKHMKLIKVNEKEKKFLNKYNEIIIDRCGHLIEQSNYIATIDL